MLDNDVVGSINKLNQQITALIGHVQRHLLTTSVASLCAAVGATQNSALCSYCVFARDMFHCSVERNKHTQFERGQRTPNTATWVFLAVAHDHVFTYLPGRTAAMVFHRKPSRGLWRVLVSKRKQTRTMNTTTFNDNVERTTDKLHMVS